MRIRVSLLCILLMTSPAHALTTGVWGESGPAAMPDARVGTDHQLELGTRLIAIGGLPTALMGYGRFTLMATEGTLMYGIPGHALPTLSLKHQLLRPTLENPTAVAVGLGMLGVQPSPGIPGSNLTVTLTRDINMLQNGKNWTLFSTHLGFRTDLSLQSRLMTALELPFGPHGNASIEWIGAQGTESGYANFGLNLSPSPALALSMFSLGHPNASILDRGLAIGVSFSGTLPRGLFETADAPAPTPASKPVTAVKPPSIQVPSVQVPSLPPPPKAPAPLVVVAPIPPALPSLPPPSSPSRPISGLKPPAAPLGTLIGRAMDAAGKAIADGRITLDGPGTLARETKSTPSGYFTFAGLANGNYTLTLSGKNGQKLATQTVTIAGAPVELTLQPESSARLKGRVVDARNGTALLGATVAIGKGKGVTDEDGYFSLENLQAPPWKVSVTAKGYGPSETTVAEGSPRIALSPLPGSVSGRILNAKGKPVVGAIVQAGPLRTASDRNGRFSLANVPAGNHTLAFIQDGNQLHKASIQVPPGGKIVKDATIREAVPVGRFGMIGGQVKSASGEGLQGVKIVVEGKAVTVLTVSDNAGRFSVLELAPGDYRLMLSKGSYPDHQAKAQVKAGSQASVNVVMRDR